MKAFIVLLGVVFAIVGASAGETPTKCENPTFTCDKNNLEEVFLKDLNITLKCQETHQCNIFLKDPCNPCIEKSDNCYDTFTCMEDNSVVIEGLGQFKCIENEVCNTEYVQPCSPCVTKVCDEPIFKCDPVDNTKVIKHNMIFKCASGYFCNSENKLPCSECINKEGIAGSSLFQFML